MQSEHSELSQDTLWDNAMWGLAFVSKTGRFLRVNPALCSILEYTESELMEITFQSITHPSDLYDDIHMSEEVEKGNSPYYIMTKRYITKTDRVVWAKLRVDRVETKEGIFVHFLSQISPAIQFGKAEAEMQKGPTSVKKSGFWSYLKCNLKWILPLGCTTIITLVGGGYKVYHEWELYKAKVDSISEVQQPYELEK